MNNVLKQSKAASSKKKVNPLDQQDQIYILKNFQDQLLQNIVLRGVKGINGVTMRKIKDYMVEVAGYYKQQEMWVLDTMGTNLLEIFGLSFIDYERTITNDIVEVNDVLGIEAVRQCLYNELSDVLEFDGGYINFHHMSLLVDRMTFTEKIISVFRHGLNGDDTGPIAKASFEETPEQFLKAARHGELDLMKGISATIMAGDTGFYGTSSFQTILNMKEFIKLDEISKYEKTDEEELIEKMFLMENEKEDFCSSTNLKVDNNVSNIHKINLGKDEDDYEIF
jgi:DNA-directed RNA polymerase II subunit RPB1